MNELEDKVFSLPDGDYFEAEDFSDLDNYLLAQSASEELPNE